MYMFTSRINCFCIALTVFWQYRSVFFEKPANVELGAASLGDGGRAFRKGSAQQFPLPHCTACAGKVLCQQCWHSEGGLNVTYFIDELSFFISHSSCTFFAI